MQAALEAAPFPFVNKIKLQSDAIGIRAEIHQGQTARQNKNAIQIALDAAADQGGGVVSLAAAEAFALQEGLKLVTGQSVSGASGKKTHIYLGDGGCAFDASGTQFARISNLQVDSGVAPNSVFLRAVGARNLHLHDFYSESLERGLDLEDTYYTLIENAKFFSTRRPIRLGAATNSTTILNSSFYRGLPDGMEIEAVNLTTLNIIGSTFENLVKLGFYGVSSLNILGNYFEDDGRQNDHYLELGNEVGNAVTGALISANLFNHGALRCMSIRAASGVVVEANHISTAEGIELYQDGNSPKSGIKIGVNALEFDNGPDKDRSKGDLRRLIRRVGTGGSDDHPNNNVTVEQFGYDAPEYGDWRRGDTIWHPSRPVMGDSVFMGRICVETGTPGKWRDLIMPLLPVSPSP